MPIKWICLYSRICSTHRWFVTITATVCFFSCSCSSASGAGRCCEKRCIPHQLSSALCRGSRFCFCFCFCFCSCSRNSECWKWWLMKEAKSWSKSQCLSLYIRVIEIIEFPCRQKFCCRMFVVVSVKLSVDLQPNPLLIWMVWFNVPQEFPPSTFRYTLF